MTCRMSAGRKINCVQIQFFVQWRRNSGIVEAIAEHDSRPKRFIGMLCRVELEHIYLEIRRLTTYKIFPHQLEIPHISARMEHREKERTQYEFCAFARPHGIQPSGRFE